MSVEALAQLVFRAAGIRNQEDLDRLRSRIEYERDQWEAVVHQREQQLLALDAALEAHNTESKP